MRGEWKFDDSELMYYNFEGSELALNNRDIFSLTDNCLFMANDTYASILYITVCRRDESTSNKKWNNLNMT